MHVPKRAKYLMLPSREERGMVRRRREVSWWLGLVKATATATATATTAELVVTDLAQEHFYFGRYANPRADADA